MQLKDKVCFVTGAAGGIGRATAVAMARAGAKLVISDLTVASLEETASLVKKQGNDVLALALDITDVTAVRAAVQKTLERFGRLDCAHNNAGIVLTPASTHETSFDGLKRTVDVNLYGTFHCMQAEIELMLKQGGGTIVNTASIAGMVGSIGNGAYCASKAAVIGLTRTAAVEYAAHGIRINAVSPGVIETAMTVPMLAPAEARKAVLGAIPAARFGSPEEIADVVVWLSSSQSSYLVGAIIAADGGFSVQ
ncbi:MAG: glucose 1-dehydrogenase [Steroidobacteraceae bacterium]